MADWFALHAPENPKDEDWFGSNAPPSATPPTPPTIGFLKPGSVPGEKPAVSLPPDLPETVYHHAVNALPLAGAIAGSVMAPELAAPIAFLAPVVGAGVGGFAGGLAKRAVSPDLPAGTTGRGTVRQGLDASTQSIRGA